MVTPAVGDVVLVPFPFSDLSDAKLRPAFVVSETSKGDWICPQITSNSYTDNTAIEIKETDFQNGSLSRVSYARPGKLFTANSAIFRKNVGSLSCSKG